MLISRRQPPIGAGLQNSAITLANAQHPATDQPSLSCSAIMTASVSTKHLPGRLTEEDIVKGTARRKKSAEGLFAKWS